MSNPSISVIVPVYKVEQYIKLCVDSILAQTFQDFEIILVDDATPDNSFALCQELYSGNDKVKFVRHEKNLGLGAARNTGMKHARGKYIYFVDSDDFILPETLEKFFNAAEKNNAQVVHAAGWFELYQDEPEPIREENLRLIWDNYSQEGFLNPNIIYRLTEHWATGNIGTMAWLCFCRRDFLEEKHIEFLPIISEDEPFNFALFCLAERYYIMHEAFYLYRRRSGSIMSTKNAEQFSKSIQSIVRGAAYIKNFLDHVPRFKGYEQWHKTIMDEFFRRFIYNHTAPYYSALTVPPEINSAAEDTLKKFFGDGTPFVKNFFDGYHLFRRQSEILLQRNNALSAQMMSIFNRMELSAKKIVFVNFLGRGYGCNPKYIAEEILRQNLPYDMVWLVNDLNESMPEKIRKVSYGSLDSIYELATAKVIVSNVKNLLPYPNKKRGQFFIMTWHAWQGLKYIEKDAEEKLSPTY
ncbi:MAG: glycosyltransferase, partial [Selenomonadaceae bacterium]|nr:glycosyltransferase [Selenomonadaceae bacterium]